MAGYDLIQPRNPEHNPDCPCRTCNPPIKKSRCVNLFYVPVWFGVRTLRCDLPKGHAGLHSHPRFRRRPSRLVRRVRWYTEPAR